MKKLLLIFISLAILIGCSPKANKNSDKSTENILEYAQHLRILIRANHALIVLTNPSTKKTYRYCISKNPKFKAPEGYLPILSPVRSIIAFSGTEAGMLTKLNSIETIHAVSDLQHVYSKELIHRIQSGQVVDFGGNQTNAFERILACKSKLLIYSGFEEDFPKARQLKDLGTLCIPNFDWKENHPLGKAEWIVFMGLLIGKEKQALAYIENIKKAYVKMQTEAARFTDTPTVFSGNLLGDTWYLPAGKSYNAKLIQDAGGSYVYRNTDGIGSLAYSMEKIFTDNKNTTIWMNPGLSKLDMVLKNNPKMHLFTSVKSEQVYCYSHDMNKFWELSAIEPHKLLADLIKIFHREAPNKDDLYFYHKVSNSE